jgi:choline dehydrogenase
MQRLAIAHKRLSNSGRSISKPLPSKPLPSMRSSSLLAIALSVFTINVAAVVPSKRQATNLSYEYIVVGSGAGGGPLASRLARAGHSVLLIEAGDDQGTNYNVTIPAMQAMVSSDPKLRWDFYVNHYQDQTRAQRDPKYVYDIGNGQQYVGLNPPAGAKPLGIL